MIYNYSRCLEEKKHLQDCLLEYIGSEDDEKEKFINLTSIVESQNIIQNPDSFNDFLILINKISNNHHYRHDLFKKIDEILLYYNDEIILTFSTSELFKIFKGNKRILYYLLKHKILNINEYRYKEILSDKYSKFDYPSYFYPEINKFHSSCKFSVNDEDINEFNSKREKGVNDNYICQLIQDDSIDEFVIYVNKKNISLTMNVPHSIFETNRFLYKNNPTLIEYAVFYGSIQIFNYIRFNNVELNASLWLYAVHGRNYEIIHLLEENRIEPRDLISELPLFNLVIEFKCERKEKYYECFCESIKSFHNEIADYIIDNLYDIKSSNELDFELRYAFDYDSNLMKYNNYYYFPKYVDSYDILYQLCKLNKIEILKLSLKEINSDIILNSGGNLLCIAIQKENIKIVNILLNLKDINVNSIINRKSLLHEAADTNNIDIFNLLLSNKKIQIGTDTFNNCQSLDKLIIPSFITKIGSRAFNCCSNLNTIIIPSSIEIIEDYAFSDCFSLSQIKLPSLLKSIGNYAFNECKSLTEIAIPSSVEFIGEYLFKNCISLIKCDLPTSIKSIPDGFFYECQKLIFINMDFIVSIGDYAFCGCSNLSELKIPSTLNKIGKYAFKGINALKEVSIPNKINSVGEGIFNGCSSLKKVEVTSSFQIKDYFFQYCESLEEFIYPTLESSIPNCAFCGCKNLVNFIIPSSVKSIWNSSFEGCINLNEIVIPQSVQTIGEYAFFGCCSLKSISIPSSVISIGKSCFRECTSLEELKLPPSLKIIEESLFYHCSLIVEVEIPDSVQIIKEFAFYNCHSLSHITIPNSVLSIEQFAFANCPHLTNALIPNSVIEIGKRVFAGCFSLSNIVVNQKVKPIEDRFYNGLKKKVPKINNEFLGITKDK